MVKKNSLSLQKCVHKKQQQRNAKNVKELKKQQEKIEEISNDHGN